jgi:sensor histidine kinase regulating citrate/malate metabolism
MTDRAKAGAIRLSTEIEDDLPPLVAEPARDDPGRDRHCPRTLRPGDSAHAGHHEGTGLGLSLARRLAELHGASFHLKSPKRWGTIVTIALPGSRAVVDRAAATSRLDATAGVA